MVAWIHMVGRVIGSTLVTETDREAVASFIIADEQSALDEAGRTTATLLPWCQVVCTGAALVSYARSLAPGDEMTVRGELMIQKQGALTDTSDAVLVSVLAESMHVTSGRAIT
ncbi:hypothetical protein [Plantibacter sp. 2H11-2]|uniref:hypothetical protein n=1 Tax=Plantibacter sp. 2H11-2 TaxID=3414431 RepID=UPI003CE88A2F